MRRSDFLIGFIVGAAGLMLWENCPGQWSFTSILNFLPGSWETEDISEAFGPDYANFKDTVLLDKMPENAVDCETALRHAGTGTDICVKGYVHRARQAGYEYEFELHPDRLPDTHGPGFRVRILVIRSPFKFRTLRTMSLDGKAKLAVNGRLSGESDDDGFVHLWATSYFVEKPPPE